jgi:hypothetical protein
MSDGIVITREQETQGALMFLAILTVLLALFLVPYVPLRHDIQLVAAQDQLDSECIVALYEDVHASNSVYGEIPCSIGSGPLEIDLSQTPMCLDDSCDYQLAAEGYYFDHVFNSPWTPKNGPVFVTVMILGREQTSVTIEIVTPKG